MEKEDPRIAAVAFRLTASEHTGTTTKGVMIHKVTLEARTADPKVWAPVEARLKAGLTLYPSEGLQGDIIKVLREEVAELKAKNAELETKLQQEAQWRARIHIPKAEG